MPGVKPEDIDISVIDDALTLKLHIRDDTV